MAYLPHKIKYLTKPAGLLSIGEQRFSRGSFLPCSKSSKAPDGRFGTYFLPPFFAAVFLGAAFLAGAALAILFITSLLSFFTL